MEPEQGFEDGLPPKENGNLPINQWNSSYKAVALKNLERTMKDSNTPEELRLKKEKLESYIDAVDREVVDNFQVFESENHPGVRFPYSSVNVNRVASSLHERLVDPSQEQEPRQKLTYVIFASFSQLAGGDPDDEMNSVYDRVFATLPKLKTNPNLDINMHILGLPTSRWGSVSDKWVEGLEKGVQEKYQTEKERKESESGFTQHGSLYSEFLKSVLDLDPQGKEKVGFYASSMGSILASETAKKLPEIWDRLHVLIDVPTGTHEPSGERTKKLPFVGSIPLSQKGLQVLAGFGAEVAFMMFTDDLVKTAFGGKKAAQQKLVNILRGRGMATHESDLENKLKKSAYFNEIKLLVRGTPLDTQDFRTYVVQGMLDPATLSVDRLGFVLKNILPFFKDKKRFFAAGKRSLGMGINYTHWMDRGRWLTKWVRNIENYEK